MSGQDRRRPECKTPVTPEQRVAIVRARTEGRLAEYGWRPGDLGSIPGGCGWMSEMVARVYGWRESGGCYVTSAGHIDHMWNALPDGRILDTTADQFGEADVPADGIRIAGANDPRYDSTCDGEDQIG